VKLNEAQTRSSQIDPQLRAADCPMYERGMFWRMICTFHVCVSNAALVARVVGSGSCGTARCAHCQAETDLFEHCQKCPNLKLNNLFNGGGLNGAARSET
jgi:hypothetical protein